MSRQPSAASARYKISNPQPLPSASRGYDESAGYTRNASNGTRGSGDGAANLASESTGSSPARPARSRLRDAPRVPSSSDVPTQRQQLRPLQTQDLRRPSATLGDYNSPVMVSPVQDVMSPGNALFSDPFAADRNQRTQLRQQTSDAKQAGALGATPGADKLRSAVGAFMAAGRSRDEVKRPPRDARRAAAQRQETWDMETPDGSEFGDIDVVLKKIKKDWPFILESDFSPATLALSLLSQSGPSSLPPHPSLASFLRLNETLSSALQAAVQAHFQTFAASLPGHASFLTTLGRAQDQVRRSKAELTEAREGFAGKGKGELAGVRARERMVRDMLKILDIVDDLKQVPDRLEGLIGDKRFLPAAVLLVRSLKTINKPELEELGALSDLRAYFTSQETTLTDILIDELHSHIYLKTYYSDSRWQAYVPGQLKLPELENDNDVRSVRDSRLSAMEEAPVAGPGPSSGFSRYITSLSNKPNSDPLQYLETEGGDIGTLPGVQRRAGSIGQAGSSNSLASIADGGAEPNNPEVESFAYIEVILEALAVLGRLGVGLDRLVQRAGGEVHALVEATLDEVDGRVEQRREEAAAAAETKTSGLLGTAASLSLEVVGPPHHAAILRDLFWTLYSKLAAVLEGHRIVYEVARSISTRRDFKDTSIKGSSTLTIPVVDIYKPMQAEVRTMLRSYLIDDTAAGTDVQQYMSLNEIIRDGKIARDKQRQMFKFANTDPRSHGQDFESLQQVLKASVPGLVTLQDAQNVMQGEMANAEDRYSASGKHRNIIPPNAFNVSTLFQPTLAFIERAGHIIPPGFQDEIGAFSMVLEDFVVKVFLPRLDERVNASFQQAVSGYDAFQIDRRLAGDIEKPPIKSSSRVMSLIHHLCIMLATTPFHRENYSRLIVGVIVQYYQHCSSRFKELASLSVPDTPLSLPAMWAQREDVIELLADIQAVIPSDRQELALLCQKEIKLGMDTLADRPLLETELIRTPRKIEALGHLAESLRWFIDSLLDIQEESEDGQMMSASTEPKLPLTRAMSQRFDAIIQTYEQLTEMVLNTIRLEIRGRVICNLGAAMRTGDFDLASEALELDPDVVDLNSSLIELEDITNRTLSAEDRSFIFRGVSHLVDFLFIYHARQIKIVNAAGIAKIKRNIFSVQQCLTGIEGGEEALGRSMIYWDLWERGPKYMLETLRSGKPMFSFDDYNTMLNLQCKTSASDPPSSELNTYLIDLHALSMSIEGWEIGST